MPTKAFGWSDLNCWGITEEQIKRGEATQDIYLLEPWHLNQAAQEFLGAEGYDVRGRIKAYPALPPIIDGWVLEQ